MKVKRIKTITLTVVTTGILLTSTVSAQSDSLKTRAVKKNKFALSIDLTTPFASFNPRYKVGVYFPREKNREYSVQLGFGHEAINPYMPIQKVVTTSHEELENYIFIEICPEIRFYSANLKSFYTAYLFQFQVKKQRYYDGSYIKALDFENVGYLQTDYVSARFGINSIVGYTPHFSDKVGFDVYVGFGVRMLANSFRNIQEGGYTASGMYQSKTDWDGFRFGYNLAGGLKFFYIL